MGGRGKGKRGEKKEKGKKEEKKKPQRQGQAGCQEPLHSIWITLTWKRALCKAFSAFGEGLEHVSEELNRFAPGSTLF